MAQRTPTYTFGEAMTLISPTIMRTTEDGRAAYICNIAQNSMWTQYDWRETLNVLPPFYLIPNEQDHGVPAVSIPPDFMGLRKATLVRSDTIPPLRVPIQIVKDLELTHVRAIPHSIGYNPATQAFRLFPRVPENIGTPNFMITGEYKTRPAKVTAYNIMTTPLPFDDIYLNVWLEMLKWAAYAMAGDPRAGEVGYSKVGRTYTGQLSKAMAAVAEMARNEGMELSDPAIHPESALVDSPTWSSSAVPLIGLY